jgi:hypothetical protein
MRQSDTVDLIRGVWLECANVCVDLLGDERVETSWEATSCLPNMTVGEVAGHLSLSGVFIVQEALAKTPVRVPLDQEQRRHL